MAVHLPVRDVGAGSTKPEPSSNASPCPSAAAGTCRPLSGSELCFGLLQADGATSWRGAASGDVGSSSARRRYRGRFNKVKKTRLSKGQPCTRRQMCCAAGTETRAQQTLGCWFLKHTDGVSFSSKHTTKLLLHVETELKPPTW